MKNQSSDPGKGQRWDPIVEKIRARIDEDSAAHRMPRVAKHRRLISRTYIKAASFRNNWVMPAFLALTIILFATATLYALFGGPLAGAAGGPDLSGMVASTAGATAFVGTIFTAIALPVTIGGSLPGGLSSEILRRPLPWITGLTTVLTVSALFVLSASKPTTTGAVVASLVAGGTFGLVWLSSRSLLESGDHYNFARKQAAFMRKNVRKARRTHARSAALLLPRKVRRSVALSDLTRVSERDITHGMIRHQQSGFRHYVSQGRVVEALEMHSTITNTVLDYAHDTGGRIGPVLQIPETLFSSVGELVTADINGQRDEIALRCIEHLLELALAPIDHFEHNAIRANLVYRLEKWLQTVWENDSSRLPNKLIDSIARLARNCVERNDHDTAFAAIKLVGRVCYLSEQSNKTHISMAAYPGLLDILETIAGNESASVRRFYLKRWTSSAKIAAKPDDGRARISDLRSLLIPGLALDGSGLQERAWTYPSESVPEIIDAVLSMLTDSARSITVSDRDPGHSRMVDCYSLYYFLAVLAAAKVEDQVQRMSLAEKILVDAMKILTGRAAEMLSEFLLVEDFSEVIWSLIISVGFLSDTPEKTTDAANALLRTSTWDTEPPEIDSGYTLAFYEGLLIVAGVAQQAREGLVGAAREYNSHYGSTGFADWGTHIPSLGVGPSVNRNQIVHPPLVIDHINEWVTLAFPDLVTSDVSPEMQPGTGEEGVDPRES